MNTQELIYGFSPLERAFSEWYAREQYRLRLEEAVTETCKKHGTDLDYAALYFNVHLGDLGSALRNVWLQWQVEHTIPIFKECRWLLPYENGYQFRHACPPLCQEFSIVLLDEVHILENGVIFAFMHGICLHCGLVGYTDLKELKKLYDDA